MKYSMGKCALGITKNPSIDDFFSGLPIRSSLDVSFSSPTTVDKHTKISSEEISDGREYSLLFLYVKVVVSCKVVGLYGARRRLTNWQDTLF